MSSGDWSMTIDGSKRVAPTQFDVINPATGEVFAQAPDCTRSQLDDAMQAAKRAFTHWRDDEVARRSSLREAADVLRSEADAIARTLTREQGKPLAEAKGEVLMSADAFTYYSRLDLPAPEILREDERKRVMQVWRPLGVVGAISPWNFPVLLSTWKIAPALLAGDTVVMKPSPLTPLAMLQIGQALRDTFPPGVLNILSGGDDLGRWVSSHDIPSKLSFTGSIEAGKSVNVAGATDLKRMTLELGGNDAAIVFDDVDVAEVAQRLFWSAFANNGQICAMIKRLYVHESVFESLVEALANTASTVMVGDGFAPATQLGPLQNKMQFERIRGLVADAVDSGGHVVTGGVPIDRPGYFFEPTIVTGVDAGVRLVDEEQFGPVLPVMAFRDTEEVLARANATTFGLGGSVWSADLDRAGRVASRLEAGNVWINTHAVGGHNQPFSCAKWSGLGVENGPQGLQTFFERQTVYLDKLPVTAPTRLTAAVN